MAITSTTRFATDPTERLAAIIGAGMALIHCTAMGFMGWFEPLGLMIDLPVLRPLQNAPFGNAFIIVAYALLVIGLRGRAWPVPVGVAVASFWLYLSMYPLYVPWLHTISLLLWVALVFAAYRLVRARSGTAHAQIVPRAVR